MIGKPYNSNIMVDTNERVELADFSRDFYDFNSNVDELSIDSLDFDSDNFLLEFDYCSCDVSLDESDLFLLTDSYLTFRIFNKSQSLFEQRSRIK